MGLNPMGALIFFPVGTNLELTSDGFCISKVWRKMSDSGHDIQVSCFGLDEMLLMNKNGLVPRSTFTHSFQLSAKAFFAFFCKDLTNIAKAGLSPL